MAARPPPVDLTGSSLGPLGDVAQLARAPALQAGGQGFESHHLHHKDPARRLDTTPSWCPEHLVPTLVPTTPPGAREKRGPDGRGGLVDGRTAVGRPGSSTCPSVATIVATPEQRSILFRGGKRAAERELARLVAEQDRSPAPVPSRGGARLGDHPPRSTKRSKDGRRTVRRTCPPRLSVDTRKYRGTTSRRRSTERIAMLNAFEVEQYFRRLKDQGAGRDPVRRGPGRDRAGLQAGCEMEWGTLTNPVADTELPSWPMSEQSDPGSPPHRGGRGSGPDTSCCRVERAIRCFRSPGCGHRHA